MYMCFWHTLCMLKNITCFSKKSWDHPNLLTVRQSTLIHSRSQSAVQSIPSMGNPVNGHTSASKLSWVKEYLLNCIGSKKYIKRSQAGYNIQYVRVAMYKTYVEQILTLGLYQAEKENDIGGQKKNLLEIANYQRKSVNDETKYNGQLLERKTEDCGRRRSMEKKRNRRTWWKLSWEVNSLISSPVSVWLGTKHRTVVNHYVLLVKPGVTWDE